MKKTLLYLLLSAFMSSCIGDKFDTDKLSSEIPITPGVNFQIAHAQISLGDLFDDVNESIEYYIAEDGEEHIRIFKKEDKFHSYTFGDIFDFSADPVEVPFDPAIFTAMELLGQDPIIAISESIPFQVDNVDLVEVGIGYTLKVDAVNIADSILIELDFPSIQGGGAMFAF